MYPNWWLFPLISLGVNLAGFLLGAIFTKFIHGQQHKMQFLSLVTFQNSGWLPLALAAAMLTQVKLEAMFIYLFLFLLGFDLAIWSFGVYMLTFHMATKFELKNFFSPPVIANLFSLFIIFLGLHKFIPQAVLKPLQMAGDCTLPLALFVVGGNLAAIHLSKVDKKAITLVILNKLVILPLIGLWLVLKLRLPEMIGLLIVMQLAMPPATSLSLIIRHHRKEDLYISQGIFFGHIVSLLTIPLFLSLYFSLIATR
jgi:predicted permease